jgi:hypothetical protein
MNAFSLCLHVARLVEENHGSAGFRVDHFDLIGLADDGRSLSGTALSRLPVLPGVGYVDLRRGNFVAGDSIALACDLLDFIAGHEFEKALDLAVLMNDALVSYTAHNFSSALVAAWTVCEVLLGVRWNDYVEAQCSSGSALTSARKSQLRDFTASEITQVLELAHVIEPELLRMLDRVRRARNSWMHSIESADRQKAVDAINAASMMLGESLGREMPIALSLSASSL